MVLEGTQLETSVRFHFLIIKTTINAKSSQNLLLWKTPDLFTTATKCANAARLRNLKQHRQIQSQAVKSVDPQHLKHSYVLSVLLLLSKKCFFAECIYSGCVTKCQICYTEIFGLESLFYFKSLIAHYLTLTSLFVLHNDQKLSASERSNLDI